jgi:hypothetical protein
MSGANSQKKKLKDIKWEEARKRHHLSHEHVRMARALGMNPDKLSKIDNHKQELWKLPLPDFIKKCYDKQFNKPPKPPVKQIAVEDSVKNEIE